MFKESSVISWGKGPKLVEYLELSRPCAQYTYVCTMTVWHIVIGNIFDERRAAPPAYDRRAWSKVVSYLRVFRYVFRH